MSMVGRSPHRSRLVTLVTVAATLVAAWLPAARACACGPVARPATEAAAPNLGPAAVCPCCKVRPAADEAPRPCCVAHANSATQGEPNGCECGSPARPGNPDPTAPPRPADSNDSHVLTAALVAPVVGTVPVLAGHLASATVARLAGPPPTDLVISLSRITC